MHFGGVVSRVQALTTANGRYVALSGAVTSHVLQWFQAKRFVAFCTAIAVLLASPLAFLARPWATSRALGAQPHDVVQQQQRHCCKQNTAECGSCAAGENIVVFCSQRKNFDVGGCLGICGLVEPNYDYFGGDLYSIADIPNEMECCQRCRDEPKCMMWTWGKPDSPILHDQRRCFLKRQMQLERNWHTASISGSPGFVLEVEIKNRDGLCLDRKGDQIFLAPCLEVPKPTQWWLVALREGLIMTPGDKCIGSPQWKSDGGKVHLRPCARGIKGQHWILEGNSGLIPNGAGYCIEAPKRSTTGDELRMSRCNRTSLDQQWLVLFAPALLTTSTTSTTTTYSALGASLYCYCFMLPEGLEKQLLRHQARNGYGIFQCDETTVFSSKSVRLAGDFYTEPLRHTDPHCRKGGAFGTVMNTPVFRKIWNQILQDGRFVNHDWVVKVDPDTVFLASRLRHMLHKPEFSDATHGNGSVLHNCGSSFHGPLEILSRRAVEVLGQSMSACQHKPQEDFFLSLCLDMAHAHVHIRNDLLADKWCRLNGIGQKDPDWEECASAHVAFHPFKTPEAFQQCMEHVSKSHSLTAM